MNRRLHPIQNCPSCGRKSRAASGTESDGVCQLCFDLCGIENSCSDGGLEDCIANYGKEAIRLHREIVAKGGDYGYYTELGPWVLAQIAQEPAKTPRAPRTGGRTGPATDLVRSVCGRYGYTQHQARRILRKSGLAAPYTDSRKVCLTLAAALIQKK